MKAAIPLTVTFSARKTSFRNLFGFSLLQWTQVFVCSVFFCFFCCCWSVTKAEGFVFGSDEEIPVSGSSFQIFSFVSRFLTCLCCFQCCRSRAAAAATHRCHDQPWRRRRRRQRRRCWRRPRQPKPNPEIKTKTQSKKRIWLIYFPQKLSIVKPVKNGVPGNCDSFQSRNDVSELAGRLGLYCDDDRGSDDDQPEGLDDGQHLAGRRGPSQRHQLAEHHPRRWVRQLLHRQGQQI